MKKVLVLGATGLLGRAVVELLQSRYEVISASLNHPQYPFDLSKPDSLKALFAKVGKVDAIICTSGVANLSPWHSDNDQQWEFAIRNKLMGQINTIRYGEEYVNDGGAIILTTGILAQYPFATSGIVTMVNAGVEAAVKACVTEIDRVRINAVSPGWVAETMVSMGMDPAPGMPAQEIAQFYAELIEQSSSGEILVAAKLNQ